MEVGISTSGGVLLVEVGISTSGGGTISGGRY